MECKMRARFPLVALSLVGSLLILCGGCPTLTTTDTTSTDTTATATTTTADTSTTTGDSSSTTSLTNGQAIYVADCGSCHRLGTFDTTGTAPNLSGRSSSISNPKHGWTPTLTAQQLADLKAWVAAN
jgi:mono/diheme cytochrome c family protein